MSDNNMPDEFFDWLNECPVQWFRQSIDKESIEYSFIVPSDESEEDD